MILSEEEKRMLGGERGPGVQKAMRFLVDYGEAFDAQKMIRVDSSHILPDPVEWLTALTEGVEDFEVMSTLHAGSPYNTGYVRALGLVDDGGGYAVEQNRIAIEMYRQKGAYLTLSCAPYLMGNTLRKNSVFTWAGSSGIVISNSLIGARGNRESGVSMTCSSITGRTPDMLRTRPEGRYGEVLFNPRGFDPGTLSDAQFGAMGYFIGSVANEKNVVIDTVPDWVAFEKLKYLLSPMPVSGAVSMCHITGVTPEAPTLDAATGGRKPVMQVAIEPRDIQKANEQLNTATGGDVDLVMLGCPHLTIKEMKEITAMLSGKFISAQVKLWLNTNEGVYNLAKRMGYIDSLEKAGALILTETCIAMFPIGKLIAQPRTVATNSARCAHYMVRGGMGELVGGKVMETFHGSTSACIKAALSGKWEED